MSKTIAILICFLFSVESFSMEVFNYVDRHLSGSSPLKSSEVIELEDNVWLFFDDVKPNDVIARFADNVRIKGERLRPDVNCRVLIYRHGAVVVPQSSDDVAFVLYAENGLSGISEEMRSGFYYSNNPPSAAPDSLRKSLTLDNKACSFILRRGYMATLATQSDGMGYSRVFVADTADLVADDLPDLLSRKVSFVRVLPWQYVSKKGWAGSKWDTMPEGLKYVEEQADFTNSTWFYNWGTSATSTTNPRRQGKSYNQEFVPEVWGASSGTTKLYGLTDVCQLMGFNEPDHSEQSNVSVEKAIELWPKLMQTGMRLGSPATTDFNWLYNFMNECRKRNYRVDYVVVHAYWGGLSGHEWYNKLKDVYDHTHRPIWIKEWNNGANWTKETWPSGTAEQQAKQLRDLKEILTVMDTCSFVERYSIYNWVEDKRAIILGSTAKLTPAGEYYANDQPDYFYRPDMQYTPQYATRTAPILSYSGIKEGKVTLKWTDTEGEFIRKYIVETSADGINYHPQMELENPDETDVFSCEMPLPEEEGRLHFRIVSTPMYGSEQMSNTVNLYVFNNGHDPSPFLSQMLITENWSAAVMKEKYSAAPCVVLGVPTYRNKMPLGYRADNIQADAFDFRLTSWDYQESPSLAYPDTIAVMMALEGNDEWNGLQVEVRQIDGVDDKWQRIDFKRPFREIPVVIPTQISSNYASAASVRVRNVSTIGFDLKLQFEGRNHLPDGMTERVSVLAMSQGHAIYGGKEIHVGLSEDGLVQDNLLGGTRLDYGTSFSSLPFYFAAMQTENDTITSVLRVKSRDLNGATLIKDREKAVAHERVKGEQVGWIAIGDTEATTVKSLLNTKRKSRLRVSSNKLVVDGVFNHCVICDLNGRVLGEKSDSDFVQIDRLPKGIYIARIDGERMKFEKTK